MITIESIQAPDGEWAIELDFGFSWANLTIPEANDLRGKLALALDAIQCPPPEDEPDA